MSPPTRHLFFGLVIGGVATWSALRLASPSNAFGSPRAAARAPSSPLWSWRDSSAPPLLARDAVPAAVSAWLAQRSVDGVNPSYATRVASLRALVLQLPPNSLPLLLEPISHSGTAEDKRLVGVAFSAWIERDAPGASRWAAAGGAKFRDLAQEAVAAWAAQDPAGAAAWVCVITDPKVARALAGPVLAALALHDASAALAFARSRDGAFLDAMLPAIIGSFGHDDPAGSLRAFVPTLWDNGNGVSIFREAIRTWAQQDSAAAASWLLSQSRHTDLDIDNWIESIGDCGPVWHRSLANAIATTPALEGRVKLLCKQTSAWAEQTPAEALAWIQGLSDADLRLSVLERTFLVSSGQPLESLAFALALPEGSFRNDRIESRLRDWAREAPEAALAWMHAHESAPGVLAAYSSIQEILLGQLAAEDPQAALAEWQTISDPKARLDAVSSIASAWGRRDPAAALQWAEAENEKAHKDASWRYTDLFCQWVKTDSDSALRWVEDWAARAPDERDTALSRYLESLAGTNGETAPRADTANLYSQIKNPQRRTEILSSHVREWLTKDPAAAKAWLESHDALTPAQAAALLAPKP